MINNYEASPGLSCSNSANWAKYREYICIWSGGLQQCNCCVGLLLDYLNHGHDTTSLVLLHTHLTPSYVKFLVGPIGLSLTSLIILSSEYWNNNQWQKQLIETKLSLFWFKSVQCSIVNKKKICFWKLMVGISEHVQGRLTLNWLIWVESIIWLIFIRLSIQY